MSAIRWFAIQERGALAGMWTLYFAYRVLGRWGFRLFLYPVMLYYFATGRRARDASRDYLRRLRQVSPDAVPATNLTWLSFRHFVTFGEVLLDKVIGWLGAFHHGNVQFDRYQQLRDHLARKEGLILFSAHLGNLEICQVLAKDNPELRLNILVHVAHTEKFNRLLSRFSGSDRINLLPVTEITPATAMELRSRLDRGEWLVIVGDRVPVATTGRVSQAPFLGEPAPFPQGPYILAGLLQCPVYLLFCLKRGRGYHIHLEPFLERWTWRRGQRDADIAEQAARYAQRLEYYCALAPLQWFNFFDFWHQAERP